MYGRCSLLSAAQFEGGAPSLQPSLEAIPRSEGILPSTCPSLVHSLHHRQRPAAVEQAMARVGAGGLQKPDWHQGVSQLAG